MSRKPINEQQPHECRQAIWDWIRKNEHDNGPVACFTVNDIAKYIKLNIYSIREYLTGLSKAGYLVATKGAERMTLTIYTLVNNTGHDAPRVRKDGTPVTQGQGRLQIWNAMQVLKTFTAQELAFNASTEQHIVADSEAVTYCAALSRAGYLIGQSNQRYQLISAKVSGPHPPQIQRTKQVYDPNLRRVVWSQVQGGAE